MTNIVRSDDVKNVIVSLRGNNVILDVNVASLYGVTTREVNQAIKNNPDKFPEGFVYTLTKQEFIYLRSKFLTTNISPKSRAIPKAIENGL